MGDDNQSKKGQLSSFCSIIVAIILLVWINNWKEATSKVEPKDRKSFFKDTNISIRSLNESNIKILSNEDYLCQCWSEIYENLCSDFQIENGCIEKSKNKKFLEITKLYSKDECKLIKTVLFWME